VQGSATVVAKSDADLRPVTPKGLAHVIAEHPAETVLLLKQLSGRLHLADKNPMA